MIFRALSMAFFFFLHPVLTTVNTRLASCWCRPGLTLTLHSRSQRCSSSSSSINPNTRLIAQLCAGFPSPSTVWALLTFLTLLVAHEPPRTLWSEAQRRPSSGMNDLCMSHCPPSLPVFLNLTLKTRFYPLAFNSLWVLSLAHHCCVTVVFVSLIVLHFGVFLTCSTNKFDFIWVVTHCLCDLYPPQPVFPDASVHGKGRQHRDEQRNLHFFAPEYGSKCDGASFMCQSLWYLPRLM